MEDFREALAFCSLNEFHPYGPKFTWRGTRSGEEILVKLDRFVANSDWFNLFPGSSARNLKPNKSDHLPIFIEVRDFSPRKKKKKRRFRFEESWLLEEDCQNVIDASWNLSSGGDPCAKFCNKITNTRAALMDWSSARFGHLKVEIEKTRTLLAFYFDSSYSDPPHEDRLALESKLNSLLHQENAFWRQRAKIFWLMDGDLNTKFFHRCATIRKRKNQLKGLFDADGVWCTTDVDMEEIILQYYGDLFTSSQPTNVSEIVNQLPCIISDEMNAAISKQLSKEEIHLALKQMHPSKSPGPDGFSPCFYQRFWSLVGDDVTEAVRCFLESDVKLQQLNCTHVALIPKVKTPQFMSQLRPISLCNVLYKIGSKALANRLKPLLKHFISPFQSAFVPGRLISDNSLMAFEIAHFLKQRRDGKVGYGALKLDMSKAYDRVEWSFLEAAMLSLGFNVKWVQWIMRCVRTVSYSFMLNGEPRGRIFPSRGLRQGDAISPYLFLICAEVLSRLISNAEDRNQIHGIKICNGAPSISHLFFADDSFIFFKANVSECEALKGIFLSYEAASGQKINLDKSSIAFSRNIPLDTQESLSLVLNVTRVNKHDMYLGMPMDISHSKMEAFGFIKEKVQSKLQSWRGKTLSIAGKEVLLKAVIQSIPTYLMSCFELPKLLCNDIHQLMAKFWWGSSEYEKKIHWIAWDKLCNPKAEGGMGFRNLHVFNLALLAKQGWRLLMSPNSLVAKVFKARYFPNTGFLNAMAMPGMSFTWRSILAGRDVLSRGIRIQIGDGNSVSIWNDPWLPMPHNFKPFSSPMMGSEAWVVGDLIDHDSNSWLPHMVKELFTTFEADIILKIPLSLSATMDRVMWHYDCSGKFNVKSGYSVARNFVALELPSSSSIAAARNNSSLWNKVWRVRVPPKIKSFMWRLIRGILPTRMALVKKFPVSDTACIFCSSRAETDSHIFIHCKALSLFWRSTPFGKGPCFQPCYSPLEWVLELLHSMEDHEVELLFMCCWVIWSERNKLIWNGGSFNPQFMATWAITLLEDYQKYQSHTSLKQVRPVSHWEFPPSGRLKINFDGAYKVESGLGGIGIVVRNDEGKCIAAIQRSLCYCSSALHAEAEACRAGLVLASQLGWANCLLETDCLALTNSLTNMEEDLSDVGRIVDDCKVFMKVLSIGIRHIYREANCVAHRLAHIASHSSIVEFWLNETPSIIEDVLFEDCCNRTRGFGLCPPRGASLP